MAAPAGVKDWERQGDRSVIAHGLSAQRDIFVVAGDMRIDSGPLSEEFLRKVTEHRAWYLPKAANIFIGRRADLHRLEHALSNFHRIAVVGAGGIGKTALSAAAIRKLAPSRDQPGPWRGGIYSHDFYASPSVDSAVTNILFQAGLTTVIPTERRAAVNQLLSCPDVLVYLEGAERARGLSDFLQLCGPANLLITSRNQAVVGDAELINLHPMLVEDAVELLLHHSGQTLLNDSQSSAQSWRALAAALGNLPLALRLCGLWLRRHHAEPAAFLNTLRTRGLTAFDRAEVHKESIRLLFEGSVEDARQAQGDAPTVLAALSLHALAPVPLLCIVTMTQTPPEKVKSACEVLVDYSIVEECDIPASREGEVEPGWKLEHALLSEWAKQYLIPDSSIPAKKPSMTMRQLYCLWWGDLIDHWMRSAWIPGGLPRFLWAQPHMQNYLRVVEHTFPDSIEMQCSAAANVGVVYQGQGSYHAARRCWLRDWRLSKKHLGPRHPDTLISLSNLGDLQRQMGHLKRAEILLRRCLELRREVLNRLDPELLKTLSTLSGVLTERAIQERFDRNFQEGSALLKEAVKLSEEAIKGWHEMESQQFYPYLNALNTFAGLATQTGDPQLASSLQREIVDIAKENLPNNHPQFLRWQMNYAVGLNDLGKSSEALAILTNAVPLMEQQLGNEHPDIIRALHNIAVSHFNLGKFQLAKEVGENAHSLGIKVLGRSHPSVRHIEEFLELVEKRD